MLNVRQLVRDDAAHFAIRQHPQQAGGGRYRGMLGVTPGGKRIRRRFVNEIHARHRQARALRQFLHHPVELRRIARVDRLRVIHAQHHRIGKPISKEISAQRE